MNTDRIVFISITAFTLVILSIILFTSLKTTIELTPEVLVTENSNKIGKDDAKVTLVEFSDFECPYCAQFALSKDSLFEKFDNNIKLVFRHYPLPMHTKAIPAARAAEAASMQGKFWEYSRELFASQPDFSDSDLEKYAKDVGLDIDKFKNDFKSQEVAQKINDDIAVGGKLKINGTPTFYLIVDGKVEKVKLSQTTDLEDAIKKYIPMKEDLSNATNSTQPQNSQVASNVEEFTKKVSEGEKAIITKVIGKLLSDNKDVKAEGITLKNFETKDWPNSALGCEQEGMMSAQVITPGYLVVVNANGKDYNYHTDTKDNIILCNK